MQATVIKSSPNKKGNTATLANHLVRGLRENGVNVSEFYLGDMNIQFCRGCNACFESPEPDCVIQDDMHQIYEAYMNSDIVIYATPIWWWHMNAQMKTIIDRHHALLYKNEYAKNLKGKKMVLVVSFLHDDPEGVRLVERMFKSIADWSENSLDVIRHHCEKGSAEQDRMKQKEAYELGVKLAGSL